MKIAVMAFTAAMVLWYGVASTCSIQNKKETQIGDSRKRKSFNRTLKSSLNVIARSPSAWLRIDSATRQSRSY